MNNYAVWLQRILAVIGVGLLTATIPVLFPVEWMGTIHGWLGLGEFPTDPIVIYLARSTSVLYAVHGAVLLWTAIQFRVMGLVMAPFLGWLHVLLGLVMLGIDLTTPMPWYWTTFEGIPISLPGLLIIWLAKRASMDGESQT